MSEKKQQQSQSKIVLIKLRGTFRRIEGNHKVWAARFGKSTSLQKAKSHIKKAA